MEQALGSSSPGARRPLSQLVRPVQPSPPWPACSEWSKAEQLDPVGTAGFFGGFLLVEQPLPWPSDIARVPELADVVEVAASARLRLQLIVGAGLGAARALKEASGHRGERKVICYKSVAPGWAAPLARSECSALPESLGESAAALVDRPAVVREGVSAGEPDMVDVLVCTHGRRDACCGAGGTVLFGDLSRSSWEAPPATVRLWRTSHTGGHRFAPTVIVLPSATLWAWADVALMQSVLSSEGPVRGAVNRYRGCAVVGPPAYQALERAVLAEVGWLLLGARRRALDLGDGHLRLETDLAGIWDATVREGRHVPQPGCRSDPALATKQSVEWVVEGLRSVVTA